MQLMLRTALEDKFTLTFAESLVEAERVLASGTYDLVLLDVLLPDGTGFELFERLKSTTLADVPVLFLTGQTEIDQRVKGLSLGADDYILKPFNAAELRARIAAHLRRREGGSTKQTTFTKAGFRVDTALQRVSQTAPGGGEQQLDLTRIEFKLLLHFLRNAGEIFSRAQLLKQVWGDDTHVSEHTVDTHISSLRKKIGLHNGEIKSVVKKGYCFQPAKP